MKIANKYLFITVILLTVFACGKNPNTPDYQKKIAIFGFLWGNKPMTADRAIIITYTPPIDKFYDLEQAVIKNANATITEISSGNIYILTDTERPRFYFNDSLIPKPKMEYLLKIEIDNKIATATMIVPPDLKIET